MGYWDPKRKLGLAGHFLEITEQQLFLKNNKIQSNVWLFFKIEA